MDGALMTTQAELDVWSVRLHEMKIEELTRENEKLRSSLLQAMSLVDRTLDRVGDIDESARYDDWWEAANKLLGIQP